MDESVSTESLKHPTWDEVEDATGQYQWDYEGPNGVSHFTGEIVGTSSNNIATLGLARGAYDGIVVDSITMFEEGVSHFIMKGKNSYQTIKNKGIDIGEKEGLPVFYLNKITDLNPVKPDSRSAKCSIESMWSSSSGNTPIKEVVMPSLVTETTKFAESPLYLQLEKDLATISRYKELYEFFNKDADESGITFEQYTALVDLPVDIDNIKKIIKKTRNAVADAKFTHYAFNRDEYIKLIQQSDNKRKMELAEAAIPNVLAGSIILSYYKKGTDKFSENYYLKPDGKVSSTKNPSSTYFYSGLNAEKMELSFKLNTVSRSLARNVSRVSSSVGSSVGSTLNRGLSMFSRSAPAAGGRRTRRKSNKSSTRKGGQRGGGRCRESCKKVSKKRK